MQTCTKTLVLFKCSRCNNINTVYYRVLKTNYFLSVYFTYSVKQILALGLLVSGEILSQAKISISCAWNSNPGPC